MRRATALATTVLLLPPAAALSQPGAGSNVVVIQVTGVRLPVALPGPCLVRGVVAEVREGTKFGTGQALRITVPCSDGKPHVDSRPALKSASPTPMPVDPSALQTSTRGVAHLNDAGLLDWAPSKRGGQISGFRILQAGPMPVTQVLRSRTAA
jgi:hypothetical protein